MSDEELTIGEQLAKCLLNGSIGTKAEPAVQAAVEEIDRLREVVTNQQASIRKEIANADAMRIDRDRSAKERDQANADNLLLRDELHRLTIENARLDGYQERVREFDPVSDKIAYADEQHPIMVRHRDDDPDRQMRDLSHRLGGMAVERRQPWYRRA